MPSDIRTVKLTAAAEVFEISERLVKVDPKAATRLMRESATLYEEAGETATAEQIRSAARQIREIQGPEPRHRPGVPPTLEEARRRRATAAEA